MSSRVSGDASLAVARDHCAVVCVCVCARASGESQWALPQWILINRDGGDVYKNTVSGEEMLRRPSEYLPIVLERDTPAIHKQEPLVSLMSPSLPVSPFHRPSSVGSA